MREGLALYLQQAKKGLTTSPSRTHVPNHTPPPFLAEPFYRAKTTGHLTSWVTNSLCLGFHFHPLPLFPAIRAVEPEIPFRSHDPFSLGKNLETGRTGAKGPVWIWITG